MEVLINGSREGTPCSHRRGKATFFFLAEVRLYSIKSF